MQNFGFIFPLIWVLLSRTFSLATNTLLGLLAFLYLLGLKLEDSLSLQATSHLYNMMYLSINSQSDELCPIRERQSQQKHVATKSEVLGGFTSE